MDTTRPRLLIRIRNRADHPAWYEFDALYRPLLFRFGRARGLGETEAEEVAQHGMAAIDRYIGSFEYDPQKGKFKSWLATMINNHIRNMLRFAAAAAGIVLLAVGSSVALSIVYGRQSLLLEQVEGEKTRAIAGPDSVESQRGVSVGLCRVGDAQRMPGDFDAALASYTECLQIRPTLPAAIAELSTPPPTSLPAE